MHAAHGYRVNAGPEVMKGLAVLSVQHQPVSGSGVMLAVSGWMSNGHIWASFTPVREALTSSPTRLFRVWHFLAEWIQR
jgi:hypothetical protein